MNGGGGVYAERRGGWRGGHGMHNDDVRGRGRRARDAQGRCAGQGAAGTGCTGTMRGAGGGGHRMHSDDVQGRFGGWRGRHRMHSDNGRAENEDAPQKNTGI